MTTKRNTAERDAAKRRGIDGAARKLHEQAKRVNPKSTFEDSQRRVRGAVGRNENRKR